ncbi:Gfo/Idh/MocA family oxidoreductase [Antribacter sp. KLBMP9083]|uniref:Gfo/Idh/MocA family oxidoreductase n=1 Tax=Antribacter soli TaxID=2910976 RepID=A0AA41QHG1_9MICO|nr:Gfo/Idh/MocA family oxidoreductase [Antribacter soli]MCF4123203.1 Gfo/Idh/MocA family oxidoreductase [Antribacter soli]
MTTTTPRPARIGLVGSGFRARTMLRVIHALPDELDAVGVTTRNAADREALATLGLPAAGLTGQPAPAFATLDELLAGRPDFVVLTLPAGAAQPLVRELTAAGVPVLQETPAAGTTEELAALQDLVAAGACVHVAEQYHLEPLVSAQLGVATSGLLGRVTDAQVSVAHDYHGVSVLRRALGVTFQDATITARRDERLIAASPSRAGDPAGLELVATVHATAWLDFGDRLGVYEFDDQQYRSWVRSPTLVVRGELGELRDETVRYVRPDGTPMRSVLERVAAGGAGGHEGLFLRGYAFEGGWAYRNALRPARLADDELSIARLLTAMRDHVLAGGPAPYELAEAAQDQYLQLEVRRAATSGTVRTMRQPWADAPGCRGHN